MPARLLVVLFIGVVARLARRADPETLGDWARAVVIFIPDGLEVEGVDVGVGLAGLGAVLELREVATGVLEVVGVGGLVS